MRRYLALAIAALALSVPPAAALAASASLPDIEDEVMCPICGTTLELSDSPQGERERAFIRRQIARGRDKEEIKQALVDEYGPRVLAVPGDSGFDLAAWLVPGLVVLGAGGAIALAVVRRRRAEAGEEPPAPPRIDDADGARLDEDIAKYDL
ncbi:MAG: hypothetical protein EXQ70_08055 [Solirubrobacterales bacterium]|nr:hypothetical protein [Solirubrobacterales bacterium]